jgi:hypothetical protein
VRYQLRYTPLSAMFFIKKTCYLKQRRKITNKI